MDDACYARYSSHAQDGGTSIDLQVDACHKSSGRRCRDYIDRARTGRSVAGRAEMLKLLEDAEAGKIGRLFVYKYDRLGRSAETHTVVAQLEECGVEVISATEGRDSLARGVQLVVAEHYSKLLAENTRNGLLQRFEQGAWTGGPPPYGYRLYKDSDLTKLAIDDAEAEIVRGLFDTYRTESIGSKELARRLRKRGVATRKGGPWSYNSVMSILLNPVYTGKVVYNQRRFKLIKSTGRRVPQKKNAEEHVSRQEERLRIISETDFNAVQAKAAERSKVTSKPKIKKGERPFTGLLFCAKCGAPCNARLSRNARGTYYYLLCGKRQRLGKDCCDSGESVREDLLIKRITDTFMSLFQDTKAIIAEALPAARQMLRAAGEEDKRLQKEIGECDHKMADLMKFAQDPEFAQVPEARKAVIREIGEVEARRELMKSQLAQLKDNQGQSPEGLAKAVGRALAEARESLTNITSPSQMREFLSQFVGEMLLGEDGTISAKKANSAEDSSSAECRVFSLVAGAGFEPATFGL